MPKLEEYIGSLVSSITNARVMSDIQTVKVAEEYAKHNLLKHFSIPRMRIDDIEMTIPIALDEVNEKTQTEYEPINNTKFNALVYKELVNNMGLPALPSKISQNFRKKIAQHTKTLEQNIRINKNLNSLTTYIHELTAIIGLELEKKLPNFKLEIKRVDGVEKLQNILAKEVRIISQKKVIEDLNVIIESHKLREQKPENIIYIKLKISEDGMEWNRTENNEGMIEEKLLPE